jgi:hypothetical protein
MTVNALVPTLRVGTHSPDAPRHARATNGSTAPTQPTTSLNQELTATARPSCRQSTSSFRRPTPHPPHLCAFAPLREPSVRQPQVANLHSPPRNPPAVVPAVSVVPLSPPPRGPKRGLAIRRPLWYLYTCTPCCRHPQATLAVRSLASRNTATAQPPVHCFRREKGDPQSRSRLPSGIFLPPGH